MDLPSDVPPLSPLPLKMPFYDSDVELNEQLGATLKASITTSLKTTPRPLLAHLNADTTWLLSLPYPRSAPNPLNRTYYHILIDPWLTGSQADVAPFFSQQWHATPSSVQSIYEVEEAIWGIEQAAAGRYDASFAQDKRLRESEEDGSKSWIDAVVVSHEFTDHMHKKTLLEVDPSVPVFATAKAADIMRSWGHFVMVADVVRFRGDWRVTSREPLPAWVGISRVAYEGLDLLYYHSAIMITFEAVNLDGDAANGAKEGGAIAAVEGVIYTPHGISPDNLETLVRADPPISTLALLHGLQDIQMNSSWFSLVKAQLNKGAHNGLKLQRMLKSKYWIGTHDEVKRGGGIVSWFLDRKAVTLQQAIEQEKENSGNEEDMADELEDVRFVELGNGESLILA